MERGPQIGVVQAESSGRTLLDVREAPEFSEVRSSCARNVPLSWLRTAKPDDLKTLAISEPVYVICRSGQRSEAAAAILRDAGFVDVFNVSGGMLEWVRCGLPVTADE